MVNQLKPVPKINDNFGEWIVISGPYKRGSNPYWLCKCSCGVEVMVSQGSLRGNRSNSCKRCGGRSSSVCRKFINLDRKVYYKLKHIVEHALWRCNDKTHPQYKDYGGRGIKVKFDNEESFIDYLLTLDGHDDLSLLIDRIDNDGNYEPGNLRFTNRLVSSRNRRSYTTKSKLP